MASMKRSSVGCHTESRLAPFLLLALSIGCSGARAGPPIVGSPKKVVVRELDVTLAVPSGFVRKKPGVWVLDAGGVRHALLWIERRKLPEAGVQAWVRRAEADLGRFGLAGVTRRETVPLGDLAGYLVEAVTLVGRKHNAAMQIVVGAEDGMYVLSILATLETMTRNRKAFDATLRSLRIPQR